MGVGYSSPVQPRTPVEACSVLLRGVAAACAPLAPVDAPRSPAPAPRISAASRLPKSFCLVTTGHAVAVISTCSSGCRSLAYASSSLGSSSASGKNGSRSAAGSSSSSSSRTGADGALLQLSPQPSSNATIVARSAPSPYAEGATACARTDPSGRPKLGASCRTPVAVIGTPPAACQLERCSNKSDGSKSGSRSSTSPSPTPAAAPALSLPDLMERLWSGAPLAAARVEEGGEDEGTGQREGPSSDNNAEPPLGLNNPKLLMPPPTCGTVPVFRKPPFSLLTGTIVSHLQMLLMEKADALFQSGTLLGRGGEGEVRRITVQGTDYALKRTPGGFREASYHRRLVSPWLQMPLAVCSGNNSTRSTGQVHYALFPLATGSLADVLLGLWGRGAGMTLPEFCAAAAESLVAVGVIHAAGLYHGDIKPGNVLLTKDGHLLLGDFGCSGQAGNDPFGSGSPVFGAPEQRCGKAPPPWRLLLREKLQALGERLGRRYDFRSVDVWGMGVTWLCLLQPDFEEVERVVTAAASWRRGPPRGWQPPGWVPVEAAHLLFHCMLVRRPRARVSVQRLQRHTFFASVDWSAVEARTVPLPLNLAALAEKGHQFWQQHEEEQAAVVKGPQVAVAAPAL